MANTTNSLSDILNDGKTKFTDLLNEAEVTNTIKIKSLEDENVKLKAQLQAVESDTSVQRHQDKSLQTDYNNIVKKIKQNEADIEKYKKSISSDLISNPNSIFDRKAYIDYARYVNPEKWTEYKKGGDKFTTNSKFIYNEGIPKPTKNDDLELNKIIEWSERYPALQLRFQDFAYCKLFGYYPNNRLIVLRRFKGGIPDNLYDYYEGVDKGGKVEFSQPLATMVSWLKPEDKVFETMTFGEVWEEQKNSMLESIKLDVEGSTNTSGSKSLKDQFGDILTMLTLDNLSDQNQDYRKIDGVPFTKSPDGNPNLVINAKKRKKGGGGLTSKVSFQLEFEYELRYINGIDPGIAMMDLISNSMRMGTSEAEFKFNIPSLMSNPTIQNLLHGDASNITEAFFAKLLNFTTTIAATLTGFIKDAGKFIVNAVKNPSKSFEQNSNKIINYVIFKYKEDLKGALSYDTGLPSGIWHVTIGNPLIPMVSCGDLILSDSTLELGKELGFNDFPNSFKVKYTLTSARERGRQELIRIFNSGRGRFYVYQEAKHNPDHDLYS